MTAPDDVTLLVVRLSDSFSDFWAALAGELGVPLVAWAPAEPGPPPAQAGVVLVAAGGGRLRLGAACRRVERCS